MNLRDLFNGKTFVTEMPNFGYSNFNDREKEIKNLHWKVEADDDFLVVAVYQTTPSASALQDLRTNWSDDNLVGRIQSVIENDYVKIMSAKIKPEWRGTGLGQMMYDKLIARAKIGGHKYVRSDYDRTADAESAWKKLAKRYPVVGIPYYAIRHDDQTIDPNKIAYYQIDLNKVNTNITESRNITDTPAFQKWFDGSKIVDNAGKPLVVFHGSDQKFDSFERKEGLRGDGGIFQSTVHSPFFFFTPDSNYAWDVAQHKSRQGHVIRAYLKMKNPLDLRTPAGIRAGDHIFGILADHEDVNVQEKRDALADLRQELSDEMKHVPIAYTRFIKRDSSGNIIGQSSNKGNGYETEDVSIEQAHQWHQQDIEDLKDEISAAEKDLDELIASGGQLTNLWHALDEDDAAEKLKSAGYDGVIFYENEGTTSYAVPGANQIKSVASNKGTYSMDSDNITESKEDLPVVNKRLNPKLWLDGHLRKKVESHLEAIAESFIMSLELKHLDIVDIIISGSNAAYTYTETSDIDLHIVVKIPKEKQELYRNFFTAKKTIYNSEHDLTIYGFPVELYVQFDDEPHIASGLYSLLKGEWIKKPVKPEIEVSDEELSRKIDQISKKINEVMKDNNYQEANILWDKIKKYRKDGLKKTGEFGLSNIVFKKLRSSGLLDKFDEFRINYLDSKLSLE
jgi:GNAT superfamily N-acetyltransferase/predicted nucleotidyltransferase